MGLQEDWKKAHPKPEPDDSPPPKPKKIVVPKGGYKGKSIGEKYTSLSKLKTQTAIKEAALSKPTISKPYYEERQEKIADVYTKMGYETSISPKGELSIIKGGKTRVFDRFMTSDVGGPSSATFDITHAPTYKQRDIQQAKAKQKKEESQYFKGVIEERPAQKAARISRFLGDYKGEETPFSKLAEKRGQELIGASGKESGLSHYPITQVKYGKDSARLGTQIYGISEPYKEAESLIENDNFFSWQAKQSLISAGYTEKVISKSIELGKKGYTQIEKKLDPFFKPLAEKYISSKIEPVFYEQAEKYKGFESSKTQKGISQFFTGITTKSQSPLLEISGGIVGGIRREPTKAVVTTAAAFVLPPILSGAGKLSTFAIGAKATGFIGTGLSIGLPIAYGTSVYGRLSVAEEPYKKAGEIIGTEVGPLFAGGFAGAFVWPKVSGYASTIGRKKIESEMLIPKDVLTGGQTFPTAPTQKHLKLFTEKSQRLPGLDEPMGYHASGDKFWGKTFEVTAKPIARPSDYPGTYISYGVSPYFTRVGSRSYSLYGGSLFESYGKPGVAGIIPKGFKVGKTAKPGWAFIPKQSTEVEAILPVGTTASLVSKKFYFKWKGTRVPIDVFKVGGGASTKGITTLGRISSSYGMPKSYPITTPSTFALGSFSASSYKPSSATSYYTSITPSYKSSTVRSRVSKISKLAKSYYPSSIGERSSFSYKSSYKPSSISSMSKISRSGSSILGSSSISRISRVREEPSIIKPIRIKLPSDKLDSRPKKKKPKRKPYTRSYRYTSTIQAGQFNIFGKKTLAGGVGLRPLVIKRNKKINKRRK